MNAWKLVYSIIVTIIALVGSAASILGWLSLAEENREGVLNFLATWQIGLLICLLIVAVFFGSWLFIRTVDIRNTFSPSQCGKISIRQSLRLLNPKFAAIAIKRLIRFQQLIVRLGPSRRNYECITDKRYKEEVLEQLFDHIKRSVDDYTDADVSVHIKLFPVEILRESALQPLESVQREVYHEDLSLFHILESENNDEEERRAGIYRLSPKPSGDAKTLSKEASSQAVGNKERSCSALNEVIHLTKPLWIGNDVFNEEYSDSFFSNSPHAKGHYNSVAVFQISRFFRAISPDNPPWGFLIIQSKSKDRFDSQILPELGIYYSNRLYFYFYHSLVQIANQDLGQAGVEQVDGSSMP